MDGLSSIMELKPDLPVVKLATRIEFRISGKGFQMYKGGFD